MQRNGAQTYVQRRGVLQGNATYQSTPLHHHAQLADGERAHAAAPGVCKGNEGGAVQRGDVRKVAADDQVHQRQDGGGRGGGGASGCP
jgi:hypothetical protein